MSDIRAEAQAISGRHNALIEASFDKVATTMGADELRDKLDQGDILGEMSKEDIWRIETPTLQRWMFESVNWYGGDIENGTYAKSVSGQKQPGVNTGVQQAILSTAAGRKFVALAKQMEHLASVTGSQVLQLVDLLDLDINIRGERLRSADIDSDYEITASFDVVDPVLNLQKRAQAMNEVLNDLLSPESFWEETGREDASRERKRLLLAWVRRQPTIHQALAMRVAREEGIEALLEEALEMAQGGDGKAGGGGTRGSNGSGLVDRNGDPLNLPRARAVEELNTALTGDVVNPDRRGNEAAG